MSKIRYSFSHNSERIRKSKNEKRQKNASILSYFAKQRRKESIEMKDHEQGTDSSRPSCSTSASQSTEFSFLKSNYNCDLPNFLYFLYIFHKFVALL